MNTSSQNCKKLILSFVDSKYLNGDIKKLSTFSFSNLEYDDYFGCPNRNFDEDDTELARSIMFLIWCNKLPELTYEEIGQGKKYRGDTINTYNTLFGKEDQYKNYSTDEELNKSILEFKDQYVTIGNFMLMPNYDSMSTDGIKSINCYRGVGSGWYDYFDKFLIELDKCLLGISNDINRKLSVLVKENEFYFKPINSVPAFCAINYLDYYLANEKAEPLFSPYLYHWQYKQINDNIKKVYVDYVRRYINKAEEMITQRSSKMLAIIRGKLKEENA